MILFIAFILIGAFVGGLLEGRPLFGAMLGFIASWVNQLSDKVKDLQQQLQSQEDPKQSPDRQSTPAQAHPKQGEWLQTNEPTLAIVWTLFGMILAWRGNRTLSRNLWFAGSGLSRQINRMPTALTLMRPHHLCSHLKSGSFQLTTKLRIIPCRPNSQYTTFMQRVPNRA